MTTALERGRAAFDHRRWADAFDALTAAESASPLAPADYEKLAVAEYLLSTDSGGADIWERTFQVILDRGDIERAARMTFWLGMNLLDRREVARGAGWIARGRRLLEESGIESSATGYLLIPSAVQATAAGNAEQALEITEQVIEIAQRYHDEDLLTMSRHGKGRTLLDAGRLLEGLAVLDEVMVAIEGGAASPLVVGIVYCSVVDALRRICDIPRVQEWTASLTRWCDDQPELQMYRGRCMLHRAELFQIQGAWPAALEQAELGCARFMGPPPHPAASAAFYREGDILRLRGDLSGAAEAFNRAAELGHRAQPGLSLLWLAQGRLDAAEAAIRRVLTETTGPLPRAEVLPAAVDIFLAAADVPAARAAAEELAATAASLGSVYLGAQAGEARGAVLLGEGEASAALPVLRDAATAWQGIESRYQVARVRLLIGLACRELGDEETAVMEIASARRVFDELGAAPDVARLDALVAPRTPAAPDGLTGREVQLLSLLATGKTNRELATELVISEKTVARHVSNIFNKLGVTSRSAATAYAYKHDLA